MHAKSSTCACSIRSSAACASPGCRDHCRDKTGTRLRLPFPPPRLPSLPSSLLPFHAVQNNENCAAQAPLLSLSQTACTTHTNDTAAGTNDRIILKTHVLNRSSCTTNVEGASVSLYDGLANHRRRGLCVKCGIRTESCSTRSTVFCPYTPFDTEYIVSLKWGVNRKLKYSIKLWVGLVGSYRLKGSKGRTETRTNAETRIDKDRRHLQLNLLLSVR